MMTQKFKLELANGVNLNIEKLVNWKMTQLIGLSWTIDGMLPFQPLVSGW